MRGTITDLYLFLFFLIREFPGPARRLGFESGLGRTYAGAEFSQKTKEPGAETPQADERDKAEIRGSEKEALF